MPKVESAFVLAKGLVHSPVGSGVDCCSQGPNVQAVGGRKLDPEVDEGGAGTVSLVRPPNHWRQWLRGRIEGRFGAKRKTIMSGLSCELQATPTSRPKHGGCIFGHADLNGPAQ